MKKKLKIPKFKNEDQEREFWSKIDLSEHFVPEDFVNASFPNLKPTTPKRFEEMQKRSSKWRK